MSVTARIFNREVFRNSTLSFVVLGIWLVFQVTTDGISLSQRNLVLLALQTSIVGLAAISAVMLIVTRNFDLSVGSAVALVGVVVAVLTVNHNEHPLLAVLAALLVGVAMGAWQGLWVARLGVSSFIVTLAGMLYFRGVSMSVTDGATIAPLPDSLAELATGFLAPLPAISLILLALHG
jgi:ABC-type xylose transport system permease subunit